LSNKEKTMFYPTPQHQKLPGGSIDYGFYDRKARELRSADMLALLRAIASTFSFLQGRINSGESQVFTPAQNRSDVSQPLSPDRQPNPAPRLADPVQARETQTNSRRNAA
jgi:hypothetical protein